MITCTLNDKKYTVPFVTGRTLKAIDKPLKIYADIIATANIKDGEKAKTLPYTNAEILDCYVEWFCLLFGNQFTPDDVYDYYPADNLIHDITVALLSVQGQTTNVLSEFPMKPTAAKTTKKK